MGTELTVKATHQNLDDLKAKYSSAKETLKDRQVFKELSPADKELALSFLEPRIIEYEIGTLKDLIKLLLVDTYTNCGEDYDKDATEDTIDDFVKDLQTYFGTATMSELTICFRRGWQYHYGKFHKPSNSVFFKWIGGFVMEEERQRLRKMVQMREDKTSKPMLSKEEQENIVIHGIITNYKAFCKGARGILVTSALAYDYLKGLGLINLTPESQSRIQAIVKKELREKAMSDKPKGMSIETSIKSITGLEIVLASKRKAVEEYFGNLKEMGEDLETIIKERKNGNDTAI